MVFSSVPLYLDPPNWHQQNPNQQGGVTDDQNPHLPPLPPPPPLPHVGGGSSSRPGSMANQARLAKIHQPEAALKCPRCDSTNTKFCYYNNYSLSQPRHFCKTCRRYWTRNGALRNVPVGGGCRRNKKSNKNQNNNSKSPVSSSERQIMGSNSTTSSVPSDIIMTPLNPQANNQLPFMASLHNLTAQFGVGNIGLTTDHHMGFHNNSGMNTSLLSGGGMQHTFFDPPTAGLFPFQTEQSSVGGGGGEGQLGSSSSRVSQLAPVKMEDNNHGLKSFLGIPEINNNNQFWSGNTWTDLSGLNSSSSAHLL